jgi:REP element-mobilizing transposase RayT
MECRFGDVRDGAVVLNDAGQLVSNSWELSGETQEGYTLGLFVVMPNHLHGIVHVGTEPTSTPVALDRFIGAFKSRVTVEYIRGVKDGRYPSFAGQLWQRSFHDRHLRMESDIRAAEKYIEANPHRWELNRQGAG